MNRNLQPVNAAIYLRISKDSEALGLGVARQRRDCEALAAARGWQVVGVFEDNDVSATRSKVRPQYERLIAAVEAGTVNGIIVWSLDRLTRSPRELEDVIDWSERHGLQLANVSGEIDLSTPSGRAMARVGGTFSRLETENQSKRLKRKALELAEAGRYVGPRPFGWDWTVNDDGTKGKDLVVNEAEAALTRDVARRVLAGESLHSITRELNDQGVRTARGAVWRTQNVRKLLMRPANAGIRIHQGVELGPGTWPPLWDRDQHDRLCALLTAPGRRTNRGTAVQHLLSGLINCALCGELMRGAKARTGTTIGTLADGTVKHYPRHYPDRYRCHPPGCQRVGQNMAALDRTVTQYVVGLLRRDGIEILGGDSSAAADARTRVEAVEARLDIAADEFADGRITGEQLSRITARLKPQLEAAHADARRAQPTEEFEAFAGPGVQAAWDEADLERKRALLRFLIDAGLKVTVGPVGRGAKNTFNPETVTISWNDA